MREGSLWTIASGEEKDESHPIRTEYIYIRMKWGKEEK